MQLWELTVLLSPLMAGLGYNYLGKAEGRKKGLMILGKCLASYLYVVIAVVGSWQMKSPAITQPLVWFVGLCVAADALLEYHFIGGMGCFAAAHGALIFWLTQQAAPGLESVPVWCVLMGAGLLLFRTDLKTIGLKAVPMVVYVGVLAADFALALPLMWRVDTAYGPLSLGTLLFFVSDLFVGKGFFGKATRWGDVLLMLLYWAALYLIVSALWLLPG